MVGTKIRIRVICDNKYERSGEKGNLWGCTTVGEMVFDGDKAIRTGQNPIDLAECRKVAKADFRRRGWRFIRGGKVLCPGCPEMGKDPETDD
jgi:hypothetical protein